MLRRAREEHAGRRERCNMWVRGEQGGGRWRHERHLGDEVNSHNLFVAVEQRRDNQT
jgi:hypothetical protein